MEYDEPDYIQLDILQLLPGVAGGRALRDKKGTAHFVDLARKAAARRTVEERHSLSRKAAEENRRRLYTIPRSVTYEVLGHRVTERIVPWWPHQKERRRRKRPVFVYIEIERVVLDEETL